MLFTVFMITVRRKYNDTLRRDMFRDITAMLGYKTTADDNIFYSVDRQRTEMCIR